MPKKMKLNAIDACHQVEKPTINFGRFLCLDTFSKMSGFSTKLKLIFCVPFLIFPENLFSIFQSDTAATKIAISTGRQFMHLLNISSAVYIW